MIVGGLGAGLAILIQTQELISLLPVLAVFTVGPLLEGFVLTPWLVGDHVGLHPITVIFAIITGRQLFGFTGVLLALPVAAVLAMLIRHVHERYKTSRLCGPQEWPSEGKTR